MEENKKNSNSKILYVVIVILSIAVVGMGLFIMYDKEVIFSKTTKEDKSSTDVIDKKDEDVTPIVNKLSEEEAMKIGQELWNYAYNTYWGGENVFKKHLSETPNEAGAKYYICDTTVEEVKQKYTSDFKADYYQYGGENPNYKPYLIDEFINTYENYTPCDGAQRGGSQSYKQTTLSINNIDENEIKYNAKSEYYNNAVIKDFIIKKVNGNWLISYFYLPN